MPYKRLSCLYDEIESNTLFKARLEPGNEFDKFSVAVEKFDIVVGNLSNKKKMVDLQKLLHFFFVEAMKTLAKLKLLGKE